MGFYDFAGSTLVHSVGGCGLAAILVLGARKGKYVGGQIRPIMPSNLPLAAVGVFLLWFGWFGFNGGSVLNADPVGVSYAITTTSIAAALGGLSAGMASWIFGRKPDLSVALNGILAGLVGITAGRHHHDPDHHHRSRFRCPGLLLCRSSLLAHGRRPIGALNVHLVCGIFGTIMAGLFGENNVGTQIVGILAYGARCSLSSPP